MFIHRIVRHLNLFLLFVSAGHFVAESQHTVQLIPKKGLHVTTNGLPWLTGSEISFFTPDKKHHHYFFTWWEQDADTLAPGKEQLLIGSRNTAVYGNYGMEHQGNSVTTHFNCAWNLQETGVADIIYAKIWLPYFREAVFTTPQQAVLSDWSTFHGTSLEIKTPFGEFRFTSDHPFKIRSDANLHPGERDYTRRSQYLLLYEDNIAVAPGGGLVRRFDLEVTPVKTTAPSSPLLLQMLPESRATAWQPQAIQTQLLPKPRFKEPLPGKYIIPEQSTGIEKEVVASFRKLLQVHWQLEDKYYPFINAVLQPALPKEGYKIKVLENGITIAYSSSAGLQHALHTLVQLVRNENGMLVIPSVSIQDEPALSWRGIHMFTGPASWPLHKRMYERVLFPLKMNKVVLQCEQAQWQSRPELHNPISVPMQDLENEFQFLRTNHNEPIPLVQSLGHMEWFFKPRQNRRLAVNPEYPYTINPELKEGREAVIQLWDEVFERLQPNTIHVGFDEIGMIGFNQPREKEMAYFKTQIDFLNRYAKSRKARLMIWGDMGLGPGEGPDALNGVTKERAATIRSFIPPGTFVADWHYLNNPDPEVYKTNLRIWKQNKNIPLASPWLWPNNVRGFVQAAIQEKAGVLQTTWADFESSERNMLLNIEQFGAYVLALDYAWSGRTELPEQLPYQATEEWVSRFYSASKPIKPSGGFRFMAGMQLRDMTAVKLAAMPDTLLITVGIHTINGFSLKAVASSILPEGTIVAEVEFLNNHVPVYRKQIRYGVEVRADSDKRMIYAHTPGMDKKTLYDFPETAFSFDRIRIVNLHPASGLKIEELILIKQ
jgi:hypothetical protein